MFLIVVGFSGVGSLRFAPWFLLLVPFAALRFLFQNTNAPHRTRELNLLLQIANAITELSMLGILVYLCNLVALGACPGQK